MVESNENQRIRIIWIDDDPGEKIDDAFYYAGIDPSIFTTAEEALSEYKTHKGTYQAVILDLRGDDGTTLEFSKAVKEFEKYLKEDLIPLYVLTSYLQDHETFKEARGVISAFGIKEDNIYHKGSQVPILISDIKKDVLERDQFKIYKKYESAFEAFENDILDKNNQGTLYRMVGSISGENNDYCGLFNEMRQIFEMIFYRFIALELLPPGYLYGLGENGRPSFSNDPRETRLNVMKYLSGDFAEVGIVGIKDTTTIQIENGRVISLHLRTVLDKLFNDCNSNSHYNPNKNWASTPLFQKEAPHFFESTALLMIDLVLWAKKTLSEVKANFTAKKIITQSATQNTGATVSAITPQISTTNLRDLKPDEKRITVKASPSKNERFPKVESFKGPKNVYIKQYGCVMGNLSNVFLANPNQQEVSVIVKEAYEIIEFEV
ncbi:MAG: hypothetical protein WCK18_19155 [Prolixibacteraceae bacterium]